MRDKAGTVSNSRLLILYASLNDLLVLKATHFIPAMLSVIFISCNSDKQNSPNLKSQVTAPLAQKPQPDTVTLKETFRETDPVVNEYLTEKLKPIRANFKRINSVAKWTKTEKKDIWETAEGGEANYYYLNGVLEKIVTRHFGETFQQLTEYYLMNGELSFSFEKHYRYNRPIYYDSASMKENNDDQAFALERSEIVEDRSYFEKGKLIHQINNQDCGSPFADEYLLEEQKRLKAEFAKLLGLITKNKIGKNERGNNY